MSNFKRVPCEIYSRIVGYFRPISQWNQGKRSEFTDRVNYNIKKIEEAHDDNV